MKNVALIFILLFFMASFAFAGNKAAVVKIVRGEAYVLSGKEKTKLKLNDWIEAGSSIKTAKKSFVKLVFIDRSQMNIGPSSEIKVERFDKKDAGVIDLVKGKIRSQVSKDYLQIDGKNRSKLFIKTPNAVMGIRGTDFLITTTGKNTAAILFEGSVVFNRLTNRKLLDSAKLDDIVDQGVRMFPGEFSAVGEKGAPTIPALLNVQQRDKLEKNKAFVKNNKAVKSSQRSIIPEGLSKSVVSSKPSIDLPEKENDFVRASANPDYFVKAGQIKPANGSFVLLDSAQIIQPGQDAVLDVSTNTYIATSATGEVKLDGSFAPVKELAVKIDVPIATLDTTTSRSDVPVLDTTSTLSTAVIDAASTMNSTSRETISTPTITETQTVQISDSLNDAIKEAPVVDSSSGETIDSVSDGVSRTTGGTVETVKDTSDGLSRFIGIKK